MSQSSDPLQALWAAQQDQLDRQWHLQLDLFKEIKIDKTQRHLQYLGLGLSLSLMFYLLSMMLFYWLSFQYWPNLPLAMASFIIGGWSLAGLITSAHEMTLLYRLDYSAPIPVLQQKLLHLRLTMLHHIRLNVWILPLYFCFTVVFFKLIWGLDIIAVGDPVWLWSNVGLSLLALPAAYWLYQRLAPSRPQPKWIQHLLGQKGKRLAAASQLLHSLQTFEQENR